MALPVQFNREPYTISTMKEGKKQVIRRVPPPKLHRSLPEDTVELTRDKNGDFRAGDRFRIESISPRQPNVLHLVNEEGLAGFVDYYDTELIESGSYTEKVGGVVVPKRPESDYLLWP